MKILLIFASILITLVAIEIGLRVAKIEYPGFYVYDENTGAALRPGAKGWWRKEGQAYIKISSDGLRDVEHAKEKPPNTVRIAVLGDSYAEAFQVARENTFWFITGNLLNQSSCFDGKEVEVINFGVSGFGTAQQLEMLRHRVWDYSPDIILLAFLTGNDIRNNSRELEKDEMRPYYIYNKEGQLVLDDSFRNSEQFLRRKTLIWALKHKALDCSRILQLVNEVKNIYSQRTALQIKDKDKATEKHSEMGLDDLIYLEPKNDVWKEAWKVTEGLILIMRDEVEQKGAEFFVVTLSNGIQVHPDPAVRKQFMSQLGINDLFYPDKRIAELGKQEGINVLNLAPILQKYAEDNKIYLHGFSNTEMGGGHWNENGHKAAGHLIAEWICNSLASTEL